jgi:hypothetical protein
VGEEFQEIRLEEADGLIVELDLLIHIEPQGRSLSGASALTSTAASAVRSRGS